jgi:hypothetical protein
MVVVTLLGAIAEGLSGDVLLVKQLILLHCKISCELTTKHADE